MACTVHFFSLPLTSFLSLILCLQDCYERFVCVENARTGNAVVLKPGQSWEATADFSVVETA